MSNMTCQDLFNKSLVLSDANIDFTNTSYPGNPNIWKDLHLEDHMKLFFSVLIIIGGILGNLGVIFTVTLNRSMRTTINIYVANLAATDALICIICMVPHAISVVTLDAYILGEFMCKFNPFTQMTCLICSVLTLSAISCDRFMAIIFPFFSRVTKHRIGLVMTIIWIFSILISLPFLFIKKQIKVQWKNLEVLQCAERWPSAVYFNEDTKDCDYQEQMKQIYYVVVSVTLFVIPFIIMALAYSLIFWRLSTSKAPGEDSAANAQILSRSKRKVIKMILYVLVAFIVCWTPIQVVVLYSAFVHNPQTHGQLSSSFGQFVWFAYFIAYANSFVNPIIYGGFNKSFRDGFWNMLNCRSPQNHFRRQRSGIQFGNIGKMQFIQSLRTMSTALSSLRSRN